MWESVPSNVSLPQQSCSFFYNFPMEHPKSKIRSLLLYEFQLGHGATEATKNVCTTLGKDAVNIRTTQRWFEKFRQGDQGLEDQPRSGRPRELDREALIAHVEANPTKSTRMLAADFDCCHRD